MAEDKDPFAEFGGSVTTTNTDPFAEFGGEALKKKEPTTNGSSNPASPLSTSGASSFPPITLGEETLRQGQSVGDVLAKKEAPPQVETQVEKITKLRNKQFDAQNKHEKAIHSGDVESAKQAVQEFNSAKQEADKLREEHAKELGYHGSELNWYETFLNSAKRTSDDISFGLAYMHSTPEQQSQLLKERYERNQAEGLKPLEGGIGTLSQLAGGITPYMGIALASAPFGELPSLVTGAGSFGLSEIGAKADEGYAKAKAEGKSDEEAAQIAHKDAMLGAVTGVATGGILHGIGGKEVPKSFMDWLGKMASKNAKIGGLFGATQAVHNIYDKAQGLKQVGLTDNVLRNAGTGFLMGAFTDALHKIAMPEEAKSKITDVIAYTNPQAAIQGVTKAVEKGTITQPEADNILTPIVEKAKAFNVIPPEIPFEQQTELLPTVQEIQNLEAQKKTTDPAFHSAIDAQLEAKRKELAEKTGAGLTEKEQKEYEGLVEKRDTKDAEGKKEKLAKSEKDKLAHYEERISKAKENEEATKEKAKTQKEEFEKQRGALEKTVTDFQEQNKKMAESILPKEKSEPVAEEKVEKVEETPEIGSGIVGGVGEKPVKQKIRSESLESGGMRYFAYDENGDLGSIDVEKVGDKIIIDNAFVKKDYQRKGIAKSLVEKIKKDFKAKNEDIEFGIAVSEEGAAFKEALGKIEPVKETQKPEAPKIEPVKVAGTEVVEHGEDTNTAQGLENGIKPTSLTEKGIAYAKALGKHIVEKGKNLIVTSDVARAKETAKISSEESGVKTEVNKNLNTWNIGEHDGGKEGSFDEKYYVEHPAEKPEGGESFNDFKTRMEKAYADVKAMPKEVQVVAHSKVQKAFKALDKTDGKWTDETSKEYLGESKIEPQTEQITPEVGAEQPTEPTTENVDEPKGDKDEPKVAGISNRVMKDIERRLGITAPESGEGIDPANVLPLGRELLKAGGDVDRLMEDFDNGAGVTPEGVAMIRAKAEELTKVADDAKDKFGLASKEFNDAAKALQDFQYRTQPYKTKASNVFKSYQGATDLNTGSFIDLRGAWEEKAGREPNEKETKQIEELSNRVKEGEKKYQKALDEISRLHDEAAKAQEEKEKSNPKKYTEKAKKAADAIRKLKTKPFTFIDSKGNKVTLTQNSIIPYNEIIEGVAKLVEAGGEVADAVREVLSKYENEDWYKNFSQEDKDLFENKLAEHLTPEEDDIHTKFVDKKGNDFTPKEAKEIWDYAKENYLSKGKSPQDMVRGVATDLVLTYEQVNNAIATPKTKRNITDEMYLQYRDNQKAIRAAKDFVEKAGEGKVDKAMNALERAWEVPRNLQTAGHGTVSPATHVGIALFNPFIAKENLQFIFHTYNSAYGLALKKGGLAKFEQRVSDFKNDAHYADAIKHGLDADAEKANNDYAPAKHIIGRIGQIGDRGFFELKPYRLELYKKALNSVPEVVKSDPIAYSETKRMLASMINNATGVGSKTISDKIPSKLVFAPKLVASQLGRLIAEPAEAAKVFTKVLLGEAKPSEKAAMKIYAAHTASMVAGYASALALNQAYLSAVGSNQKVNFTDPDKPDFLRMKSASGRTLAPDGGVVSMFKFLKHIAEVPFLSIKEAKGDRLSKMGEIIIRELRGKSHPSAGIMWDFVSGKDFNKNIVPTSSDRPKFNKTTGEMTHKMTWGEYALKHLTPIPAQEAMHGAEHGGVKDILSGIISGITGFRIGEEDKKEKK